MQLIRNGVGTQHAIYFLSVLDDAVAIHALATTDSDPAQCILYQVQVENPRLTPSLLEAFKPDPRTDADASMVC